MSLKVQPIKGEQMRFHVASASGNKPHLVDLAEEGGQGWCSCENFAYRVGPNRKKGKKGWCRHIKTAYAYFGWQMAQQIAKEAKKHAPYNPI